MSVIDLNELVKLLEKKFGVSPKPAAAAAPVAGAAAAGDEKSTFAVHLASAGEQKIAVIKAVKELLDSASRKPRTSSTAPPPFSRTESRRRRRRYEKADRDRRRKSRVEIIFNKHQTKSTQWCFFVDLVDQF